MERFAGCVICCVPDELLWYECATQHSARRIATLVRRRHIIYLHGYDPDGAGKYFSLFRELVARANPLWRVHSDLGDLTFESEDIATWNVVTSGPNWQVYTHYHFIRYDDAVKANLAEPIMRQIGRTMKWVFGDLVSGTARWMFRTSWQFAALTVAMQLLYFVWIALSIAAGVLAFDAMGGQLDLPWSAAIAVAIALSLFMVLRPLIGRIFVIRYNNFFPYLRELGRGEKTRMDRPIEIGSARLQALVAANDADEIVVAGHCFGTPLVLGLVSRALNIDPDLGRRGPPIVMLTIASIVPAVAFHPSAKKMRDIIRRLATEPSVTWIDCQSRTDAMNFPNFDPVVGVGIDAGPERCNPLVWQVRFRDMLPSRDVRRMRWKLMRLHFQFIMPNVMRAPYDYFMLVCGPVPVIDWAKEPRETLSQISPQGDFLGAA